VRGGVFRPRALESLASPSDQLDQLIRVTATRGWLALLALVAVVVGVVLYGFLGTAPTTVSGQGLFLPPGGLTRLDAPAAGTVAQVHVTIGDTVAEGEDVVTVSTTDGTDIALSSTASGHVTELLVDRGNVLAPGQEVAVVDPSDGELTAIVFVPTGEGKAIEPGMSVQLSPSTAPSEEYGQAMATVRTVSEFPVSSERLEFVLQNDILTQEIAKLGSVLEVTVELATDETTDSGLMWTSGDGPPFEVHNGTLTDASVTIDTEKPAAKLFDPEQ
jgi:multidrug efflux pump subunit AcrA (membrane-fusion protein)